MDKVDGFLSRKAQQHWQGALVIERDQKDWILQRPPQPDVGLGDNFGSAQHALHALIRAERERNA